MRTPWIAFILVAFLLNTIAPMRVLAQEISLPKPGVMVHLSPEFNPPILKGIKVHADNPFRFEFVLDQGDRTSSEAKRESNLAKEDYLKTESTKLIKYFLASLTIPEKDLWVNLSPYEKDRIVPDSFGQTEMGRDLLAEDYMLKQITASLIYPEDEVGKRFWKRIYEEASKKFGTTNIPVNTFNKVWIVPEKAVVYENAKAGTAYVVEARLKVMLEQDYLSMTKHDSPPHKGEEINYLGSQIVREIVIPELTKEVNEDKNFAQLRQVYNSLILATWYKKKIKDSILSQVYADKNKVVGVGLDDVGAGSKPAQEQRAGLEPAPTILDVNTIYQRYLQAFKKGVYNYIKEEPNSITQQSMPRKYFSGGLTLNMDDAMTVTATVNSTQLFLTHNLSIVTSNIIDSAMINENEKRKQLSPEQLQVVDEIRKALSSAGIKMEDWVWFYESSRLAWEIPVFEDRYKKIADIVYRNGRDKTTNNFLNPILDEITLNYEVIAGSDLFFPINKATSYIRGRNRVGYEMFLSIRKLFQSKELIYSLLLLNEEDKAWLKQIAFLDKYRSIKEDKKNDDETRLRVPVLNWGVKLGLFAHGTDWGGTETLLKIFFS
ncbi:MAG: hypothetical protein HQL15_10120, partial [Candidatus Omnitrophica bacterium]|nr:hypothetical protein [Candidatus Omnitrophota bacterium]